MKDKKEKKQIESELLAVAVKVLSKHNDKAANKVGGLLKTAIKKITKKFLKAAAKSQVKKVAKRATAKRATGTAKRSASKTKK